MTQRDDEQPDERGRPDGARKLEEAAAWQDIIANYGERATLDDAPEPTGPVRSTEPAVDPGLFDRAFLESQEVAEPWDGEEHFVPPEPPPLPKLEPRRKLAWIGLFGAPLVMLLAIVIGWNYPDWFAGMMVMGFIGGFVYLVATMPKHGSDDWPGDDGAVI